MMSQTPVPGEDLDIIMAFSKGGRSPRKLEEDIFTTIRHLDMLECECIEANQDYAKESATVVSWSTLLFVHKMLLRGHVRLFLDLLEQPENTRLQQIPYYLDMPARLWDRIKDFLVLLCSQFPFSPICMAFHDLAYKAVSKLLAIATAFKTFWEERLDHLCGQT